MSKPDPGMGADHIHHHGKKSTAVNPQWMRESTLVFLQDVGSAFSSNGFSPMENTQILAEFW